MSLGSAPATFGRVSAGEPSSQRYCRHAGANASTQARSPACEPGGGEGCNREVVVHEALHRGCVCARGDQSEQRQSQGHRADNGGATHATDICRAAPMLRHAGLPTSGGCQCHTSAVHRMFEKLAETTGPSEIGSWGGWCHQYRDQGLQSSVWWTEAARRARCILSM